MEIKLATKMANELMAQHGISDWNFKYDSAKRRLGLTTYNTKTISLSYLLTKLNPIEQVRNTILHEIAHVLVGSGNGHNHVWREKAMQIGCNGHRTTNSVVKAPAKYRIVCLHCAGSWDCHRKVNVVNSWHKACGRISINKLEVRAL